ncbi:hypothetical protein NLI96_g5137 [Meripilus lineatus]|uniref:Uncharacterized protein n=1 Tax=Meripilus lineatus TaxID=2056292 RepID=A0AAD5YJ89_9APHY|nr:hypothetical protein NLI96_g5137 [Physisporinus lineatus]
MSAPAVHSPYVVMTSSLLCAAFSVPWQAKPLRSLILWKLGFPQAILPTRITRPGNRNFIVKALVMLHDAQDYGSGMSKLPLLNIVELCCTISLCVARCDNDILDPMKDDLLNLTSSLVDVLTEIPPPSDPHPVEVFRCQYALNMAMRANKLVPGIISGPLLEALHLHSVKMFDTILKSNEECLQEGPVDISQAPIRPSGEMDWDQIIEDWVEVDVRDPGDYGDQWEYWRTRFDCKHRMEFMLRWEGIWGRDLREVLAGL